jgi:hypothetical protein
VFVAFAQSTSSDVVANWFPVHVGDKWIYSHERKDDIGDAVYRNGRMVGGSLQTSHWETEETTTGLWNIPEGTLVGRHFRVSGGSRPQYDHGFDTSDRAFLIRGDCLYSTEVEWDPQSHQLKKEFREDLLAGHLSADFCFPLVTGKTWGAPHFMDWRSPAAAKDWKVTGVNDKRTMFHVTSIPPYLGSGMTEEIWFERGVGLVRDEETHHGTVGEERTQLVRFEPAPQK